MGLQNTGDVLTFFQRLEGSIFKVKLRSRLCFAQISMKGIGGKDSGLDFWTSIHLVTGEIRWLKQSFSITVVHVYKSTAAAAKSLQSCLTLYDYIDGSTPGSSVAGILQARILEWFAISFSNACMHAKSLQSCPTLYDPMDSSPPCSSVHGILQARILEGLPFPSPVQVHMHWLIVCAWGHIMNNIWELKEIMENCFFKQKKFIEFYKFKHFSTY